VTEGCSLYLTARVVHKPLRTMYDSIQIYLVLITTYTTTLKKILHFFREDIYRLNIFVSIDGIPLSG